MSEKFYEKFTPSAKNKKTNNTAKKTAGKKSDFSEQNSRNRQSAENETKFYEKYFSNAELLSHTPMFNPKLVPQSSLKLLNDFDLIVQNIRPLNSKQLLQLPENIRNLSHQMTDDRSSRRLGYMNETVQLSAYVRYFVWWNLVRLTRLFSNLPETAFIQKNGICLDLGSGPLTIVTALWLARPELRNLNLSWYCLDVSQNSLTLGEDIYLSIAAKLPPSAEGANPHWKIIRVKGSFGTALKEKASFVTCGNMFNELDQASDMPPEYQSKKYFEQLRKYSDSDAKYLLIEPGVPKAARTLSLLRTRFLDAAYSVKNPCSHSAECPMNGFKAYTGSANKWCNFAFNTEDAPQKLLKLSNTAKLPKDRAVLSFISAIPSDKNTSDSSSENTATDSDREILVRITSDPFRMPLNSTGFYGCSKLGLTLITTKNPEELKSGDLLKLKIKAPVSSLKTDQKSGALIIRL